MTQLPAIALTPDAQGRPTCLSTDVALHFQKKHLHILRDIDRLKSLLPNSFTESNFGFSEYTDKTGRKPSDHGHDRPGGHPLEAALH